MGEEHTPSSCTICIPVNIFKGTQLRSMGCVEHRRCTHARNAHKHVCTHTCTIVVSV